MGVDVNSLAEDELRFMYFKMHDADGDSRLDGCELVKSLLHWHHEEAPADHGPVKIFRNDELALMVDPVLSSDDRNADGFIDYPEFVAAQKARGF
ncbi:hypothetical protein JTE90_020974 [Oedothorax gibbosus]|nr:hypothetical protein JTE90_020974 [Oedothorax gibbosus]